MGGNSSKPTETSDFSGDLIDNMYTTVNTLETQINEVKKQISECANTKTQLQNLTATDELVKLIPGYKTSKPDYPQVTQQAKYCDKCGENEGDTLCHNGKYVYYYIDSGGGSSVIDYDEWPIVGEDSDGNILYTKKEPYQCYDGDFMWPRVIRTDGVVYTFKNSMVGPETGVGEQADGFVLPNKTNRLMSTHARIRFN